MSNVKWLNNLKLRASYGELNSTNGIGSYDAQNLFSTTPYGGGIGTVLTGSTVGNPNLKFEKQENLRLVWSLQCSTIG
jgi:outer membrane receptor protein involved in Fe transport